MPTEEHDSWLSKLGVEVDKWRQTSKKQSVDNEALVDHAAASVIDYAASGAQTLVNDAPVPDAVKDAASTAIRFDKGVLEGAYQGAKGLVAGAEAAGELASGVTLLKGAATVAEATVSADARNDIVEAAKSYGKIALDPGGTTVDMASKVVAGYEQASDKVEFVGKAAGYAGVTLAASLVGGGEAEAVEAASAGEEGSGLAQGLAKEIKPAEPPAPGLGEPTPASPQLEPAPQNVGPDPRVDPEPPPDTVQQPSLFPPPSREPPPPPTVREAPAGPMPARQPMPNGPPLYEPPSEPPPATLTDPVEPPTLPERLIERPDTLREPPALSGQPTEPVPQANAEAPSGPATEPRLAPGQEPLSGPATEPAPAVYPDPATQPRPAPGEDIPPGPATEPAPAPMEADPAIEADPATQPKPPPGEYIPAGPATERSATAGPILDEESPAT